MRGAGSRSRVGFVGMLVIVRPGLAEMNPGIVDDAVRRSR